MPTWTARPRFQRDFERLTPTQQAQFWAAVAVFVKGLRTRTFPPELRIHKVRRTHLWSLSWAPDGRATFEFAPAQKEGEVHIVWRRIAGGEVYGRR